MTERRFISRKDFQKQDVTSLKRLKSKVIGNTIGELVHVITIEYTYTVKKVSHFPVPSRDITDQTLSGREKLNYSLSRKSLISDIPAGDGKTAKPFLQCIQLIKRESTKLAQHSVVIGGIQSTAGLSPTVISLVPCGDLHLSSHGTCHRACVLFIGGRGRPLSLKGLGHELIFFRRPIKVIQNFSVHAHMDYIFFILPC